MFRRLIRLRVWRAAVSLALAVGFLATPLGFAHLGAAASDPCDTADLHGSGLTPAVEGTQAPLDPHQHCFTCHWLQSLRSASPAARVDFALAQSAGTIVDSAAVTASSAATRSFPARAPPA